MSVADNVALKVKIEECDMDRVGELLSDSQVEIVHFNKHPHLSEEDPGSEITQQQINQIDMILSQNHIKLFGEEKYHNPNSIIPCAENVDFINRGNMVVRVMDKHNFYEAENLSEEYLMDAPIGLLTKIWISISKTVKE